jgi:lipoyl(octanoyl) transferase
MRVLPVRSPANAEIWLRFGAGYAGSVTRELVFSQVGFGAAAVPYLQGWELQRRVHEQRAAGEIPDTCLLLEHQSVYTAGKRTQPRDRPVGDPGAPVIDVDRGGKITWHGPGQLVGYPIIKLAEPMDVIAYVRALEQALIDICAAFGVHPERVEGRSGAWMRGHGTAPDRKIAAIGARVSRGVTMHGVALNCDCDLSWYDRIIPCGITDAGTTSLTAEAGRRITVADVLPVAQRAFAAALEGSREQGSHDHRIPVKATALAS